MEYAQLHVCEVPEKASRPKYYTTVWHGGHIQAFVSSENHLPDLGRLPACTKYMYISLILQKQVFEF